MEKAIDSNFKKHLYYEGFPETREYKHHRCIEILGLIAQVKDRNADILKTAEMLHGKTPKGGYLISPSEWAKYQQNLLVLKRLERMYRFDLDKLDPYHAAKKRLYKNAAQDIINDNGFKSDEWESDGYMLHVDYFVSAKNGHEYQPEVNAYRPTREIKSIEIVKAWMYFPNETKLDVTSELQIIINSKI